MNHQLRMEEEPHPTHDMKEWGSTLIGGRFARQRGCKACGIMEYELGGAGSRWTDCAKTFRAPCQVKAYKDYLLQNIRWKEEELEALRKELACHRE